MITIVKGTDKIVCTKGTFEEQYKCLGYQIASEKKEATKEVASVLDKTKKEKSKKETADIVSEEEKIKKKYGLKKEER